MTGQVQQFLSDGKVSSCGVSLVAVEEITTAQDKPRVFQGSFMLAGPGGGLMKGRAATAPGDKLLSGAFNLTMLRPLKTERVWAKAQGSDATTVRPGERVQNSDDPGFIVYITPLAPLVALVSAVFDGTTIQIGTQAVGEKFEHVMYGKIVMSDDDREALATCLGEWKTYVLEKAQAH